jgi:hypothetical protein
MELKSSKPIGKAAVYIDFENEKMESVKIDTLRINGVAVTHSRGEMGFEFIWGGYDSNGLFRPATNLEISHRAIKDSVKCNKCVKDPLSQDHEPGCESNVWRKCTKDEKGNSILDHGEAFVAKVMIEHGKIKDIIEGKWDIPDLELTYKGEVVYK